MVCINPNTELLNVKRYLKLYLKDNLKQGCGQ